MFHFFGENVHSFSAELVETPRKVPIYFSLFVHVFFYDNHCNSMYFSYTADHCLVSGHVGKVSGFGRIFCKVLVKHVNLINRTLSDKLLEHIFA